MKNELIKVNIKEFPRLMRPYFENAEVYDRSSSNLFQTLYLTTGHYIKIGPKKSLYLENKLGRKFHKNRLGVKIIKYISDEKDFLLSEAAKGENCLHYLDDPIALIKVLSSILVYLHSLSTFSYPFSEKMNLYLKTNENNFNLDYALTKYKWMTKEDAIRIKNTRLNTLRNDAVIHGDFCLPNIILNSYIPHSLIDLGFAGIGDHHIDIYWVLWSLEYNLKTDKYNDLFLDLYGRENINEEILELIAALEILG